MPAVIVTGAGGLIGSQVARHFALLGLDVIGIDNNMREWFFGADGSVAENVRRLIADLGSSYRHVDADIRNLDAMCALWHAHRGEITLVVHTAAQPSHDWSALDPQVDFQVNALGTMNVLEATRAYAPEAVFIFTSTNKVYGDRPNSLPYRLLETRYELPPIHRYYRGIDESMSIDSTMHSVFGASKVAADVMVQEYGRYYGLRTAVFRGGTLTGAAHQGAELHGFLSYLMRCVATGRRYRVIGYQGKQVRDAIHAKDVATAFEYFWRTPRCGAVYNLGGGRASNVSVIEALGIAERIAGRQANTTYTDQPRRGDHIWWISSMDRFRADYPDWDLTYDIHSILSEIYEFNHERWNDGGRAASQDG